ncbi:MAG: hypothetical protein JNJ73_17805 [Hyphomonadaceae bacterium]|nr:hypothetical protein [Hyphomonadaceae bacterium]
MALIADNAADRVIQMLALTEQLTGLIERETEHMRARRPLPDGPEADEKQRFVNLYRLEIARIRDDAALIASAPADLRGQLKAASERLEAALAVHAAVLGALKELTEGLVQAMAHEVVRIKAAGGAYGADGAAAAAGGPVPVALNQTA